MENGPGCQQTDNLICDSHYLCFVALIGRKTGSNRAQDTANILNDFLDIFEYICVGAMV